MSEIAREEEVVARPRSRRRTAVVALIATGALGLGGLSAAAGINAVHRNQNGVYEVDAAQLDAQYNGKILTNSELQDLNDEGKAQYGAFNISLACRGIYLVFDTEAELDAYTANYTDQHPVQPTGSRHQSDPCS